MANKILAINPYVNIDAYEHELWPVEFVKTWNYYQLLTDGMIFPTIRLGHNTLPFKNTLAQVLAPASNNIQHRFDQDFATVTDHRYHQLRSQTDRPWVVFWSGGVDSTVIVTSILRNCPPQDRDNITIACSAVSMFENPKFFAEQIRPNFATIDSRQFKVNKQTLESHVIIDGDPADALYLQQANFIIANSPDLLQSSFRNNQSTVQQILLQSQNATEDFVQWQWSMIMDNIESQSIPVQSIHDFFWWRSFNFNWAGTKLRALQFLQDPTPETMDVFFKNFVFWFDSDGYQSWAVNNNQPGMKFGSGLGDYKLVAKDYIRSWDKDEYYYRFKTKKASRDLVKNCGKQFDWFCLLDDFTKLTLPGDLERIQSLLPDFINPDSR